MKTPTINLNCIVHENTYNKPKPLYMKTPTMNLNCIVHKTPKVNLNYNCT